jgi:dihydrofolate reductase
MAKIILYIAVSLNGKIARADGAVDWLETINNPENSDYGYSSFINSIGTTVQGNNTYKQVLSWDIPFPYPNTKNYVITSDTTKGSDENVTFLHTNIEEELIRLKAQSEKDIWLIGGAGVNALLLDLRLLDEMMIFHIPVIIQNGINLFNDTKKDIDAELIHSEVYYNGVSLLHYKLKY